MADLPFSRSERALSEADITHVEQQLGVQLPPAFRAHYLRYNGGELANVFWKDPAGRLPDVPVEEFLPMLYAETFDNDPAFSIPGRTRAEWSGTLIAGNDPIPADLLPFAFDGMRDYLYLNHRTGAICHFDCNAPEHPAHLADSFEAFMAALQQGAAPDEAIVAQHPFWGRVRQDLCGFVAEKTFAVPWAPNDAPRTTPIYLGADPDTLDDEDEEARTPNKRQLDAYAKTFDAFLRHTATLVPQIAQAAFAYYQKRYAAWCEKPENRADYATYTADAFQHLQRAMPHVLKVRIDKRATIRMPIRYAIDPEHGIEVKIQNLKVAAIDGIAQT